jgi:hypothetical protein
MKYDYHSKTSLALRSDKDSQPEMVPLCLRIDINLGPVALSSNFDP